MIVTNFKSALETISSNVSEFLDNKNNAEINKYINKLRSSCESVKRSKTSVGDFLKNFENFREASVKCIYNEAINTAFNCKKEEEPQAILLLESILEGQTNPETKSIAKFALSCKLKVRQPLRAYNELIEAFELNKSLCSNITQNDSPVHNYIYSKVDEVQFHQCPICHGEGTPYFCAMPLFAVNYTSQFSPAKLWMKCNSCGQLYTYNFPRKMAEPQPEAEELGDEIYMKPRVETLSIFGDILHRILSFAAGSKLLEVGAGTGELIAAALELGCNVETVEISKRQSERIHALLGVDVHCSDFLKFETDTKYNMITMGDVIEHVTDPTAAIKKAHMLLQDSGILWLSTPNFESGFSRIMKFDDAMWNEPWHITYFSYSGLKKFLSDNGFEILDYQISKRFYGSMEIVAKKI